MLGILVIASAVAIMAKAAETEGRSSFAWGVITLIICIACGALIPLPFINTVIGLVISFLILFAVKVIKQQN